MSKVERNYVPVSKYASRFNKQTYSDFQLLVDHLQKHVNDNTVTEDYVNRLHKSLLVLVEREAELQYNLERG